MKIPALLLLLLALSPQFVEFGDGPAQWLMTSDEKKEWRKVASDSDAVKFIDAFWARRGPAYRHEFEARVKFADERFSEKRKRGALTDRGRVYIVLGPPTNMGGEVAQSNEQRGISIGGEIGASRQQAARESWIWDKDDARKFDMARVEVVFFEDPNTHKVQRDPTRADFSLASKVAIQKSLSPPAPASPSAPAPPPAPAPTSTPVLITPAPIEAYTPAIASNTPGVSRLTLLKGGAIDAKSATDPFPASQTTFTKRSEIPWALQYCSAKAETPKLKYVLLITGAGTEQRTREKDAKLQRLASNPGCYVLQSTVPVSQLAPGRYRLSALLEEPVTSETWTLKADFSLE